jgi:hypothetical protein
MRTTNPEAARLATITRAWEDEGVRRTAVERDIAPQAEKETAVWFFPEEKVYDTDQADVYRGQIGNRGPESPATGTLPSSPQLFAKDGRAR